MSSIHWICLLFLFADVRQRVESAKPSIKLSFSPDEPYLPRDQPIDIQCELLNPTEKTESPQLWYVDLKTGKRTAISRLLLTSPNPDAPEVFKTIKNHRYEFLRKNYMRIRRLQLEDSARYECDCPDCEEVIPKQSRDLFVMKLSEPRWIIEPELPLHENTQATIKCQVEDFFPYVRHQILRNDQEMTSDGKTTLPTSPVYPQKFLWERTFEPKADWHNTTIRCLVTEGNSEQQAIQTLEVLFAPRFLECHERQHINPNHDIAQIECSYSGNPAPTFMWRRLTDQRIITPEPGITIETKDEHNGRYKAILKLNRTKLTSMPVTAQTNVTHHENYFQEIVNGGFLGQLTINGVEKDKRTIHVDRNVNQARASSKSRADFSTSISPSLVFFLLLIGTCLRWHSTSSLH